MQATITTAVAPLQMIFGREHDIALLIVIKIFSFN